MKAELLELLRCPHCGGPLAVRSRTEDREELREGELRCDSCSSPFPVRGFIPRLVDDRGNYSASWGKLWRETGALLRDSHTGLSFHRDVIHGRYAESGQAQLGASPFGFGWPEDLSGETILEPGPGTGNLTEHLAETGARLVCVDMSNAIDVLPEELLRRENVHVVQADINDPIFEEGTFDRIWLFQVLQHTPSPPATLKTMRRLLRDGGELAFTSYRSKYNPWYYRFTKRIPDRLAWRLIRFWVPKLVPFKYRLHCRPRKGPLTRLALVLLEPVDPRDIYRTVKDGQASDYIHGALWQRDGDERQLIDYVILNTFDRITPEHTNSAWHEEIEAWAREAGFTRIETWGRSGVRARVWS